MDPKWGIVEHLPDLYMGKSWILIHCGSDYWEAGFLSIIMCWLWSSQL
jgi:hypothetical protein